MNEPQKFQIGDEIEGLSHETYGELGKVTDVKVGSSHLSPEILHYDYEVEFYSGAKFWMGDLDMEKVIRGPKL